MTMTVDRKIRNVNDVNVIVFDVDVSVKRSDR